MLLNNCEKCCKEKGVVGETSSENPTCLVAGSGEAFLILFELSFEGSELSPRGTWQWLETFWVVMTGGEVGLVLLAFIGWRPEILLNIHNAQDSPHSKEIIQPQM